MAKNDTLDGEDKVLMLRSLAFHVHRKRPVEEVLLEMVETELRGSRRRIYRPAAERLAENDPAGALLTLGVISEETACVLGPVIEHGDHRLLSGALNKLAELAERG